MNVIRPYGSNLTQAATEGIPYVNVNNLAGFGSWAPGNFSQTTYSWRDVMTTTIKTHTLKFGADLFNTREVDHQQGAFTRPTFNYRNLLDLIQDEPVYQSGPDVNLQNHEQAPYDRIYRDLIEGYYLQDDWKLTPRFTLNLGVRYDTMLNFFSIYSPTLSRFNLGTGSTWNAEVASGTATLANTHKRPQPQYRWNSHRASASPGMSLARARRRCAAALACSRTSHPICTSRTRPLETCPTTSIRSTTLPRADPFQRPSSALLPGPGI